MNKTLKIVTRFLLILVVISCGISVFNNDIYQDGEWINAQWLGQDAVTLLLAAPLLWIAQRQNLQRAKWKWQLVLAGMYFYFVYVYSFYVFAAKLTFLYLFHLPIFSLSIIGLFLVLSDLFQQKYSIINQQPILKKIIIGYFLVIASMLLFLWLSDIFAHLTIPNHQSETPDGEAPLIIYSLDIAIVIPLMVIAAIGYWQDQQYGYKLVGVMLVKSSTLGFTLMGMSLSMYLQNLNPDTFLIRLWCVIGLIGTILTLCYLKQLKTSKYALV